MKLSIPGLILVLLGISFLFDVNLWRYFWPLLIIFIGLRLIFKDFRPAEDNGRDNFNYSAIFSGLNKKIVDENFRRGKISAIFGGGEIDLTRAAIKGKTATLEISAVFGGMKVIVPDTWAVNTSVAGIAGGFENKTSTPKGKAEGTLSVKVSAVFGGGEVVNG